VFYHDYLTQRKDLGATEGSSPIAVEPTKQTSSECQFRIGFGNDLNILLSRERLGVLQNEITVALKRKV
jgi:hypothetical protein